MMYLLRTIFWILVCGALYLFCATIPQSYRFEGLSVSGSRVVLGKGELHSAQMVKHHLRVTAEGGQYYLEDLTSARKVLVDYKGTTINASAVEITAPTEVQIGDSQLGLSPVNGALEIQYGGIRYHLADVLMNEMGEVLPSCHALAFEWPWLQQQWQALELALSEDRTLKMGGDFSCNTRLAVAGDASASISLIDGRYVLHSSVPEKVFVKSEIGWRSLSSYSLPIDGSFWAGRTKYLLNTSRPELWIATVKNKPLCQKDEVLCVHKGEIWSPVWRQFTGVGLSELSQLDRSSLPIELWLTLMLASFMLITKRAWHCVLVVLVLTGCLNQLILGSSAATDSFLLKAIEQIQILTLFALVIRWVDLFSLNVHQLWVSLYQGFWFRSLLILGVIAIFVVNLLYGSETGIDSFFNPAELLKVVMAGLAAVVLSYIILFKGRYIFRQLGIALLVGGFFLVAALLHVMSLHDFSPTVVLLGMSLAILYVLIVLLWSRENVYATGLAVAIMAVTLVLIGWVSYQVVQDLHSLTVHTFVSDFLPALDRFKSFMLPEKNFVNAYQILQAKTSQAELDQSIWQGNFSQVPVPAIEDDFAFTHLIAKLGRYAAIAWTALFCGLCGYMISTSVAEVHKSIYSQALLSQKVARLQLAIASLLLVVALLVHGLMNIASNLGLLPVMGQPLVFISIASSHLFAFVLPTLVIFSWLQHSTRG